MAFNAWNESSSCVHKNINFHKNPRYTRYGANETSKYFLQRR